MSIDLNIKRKADDIRTKVFGSEVRESLASGLEAMSEVVVDNTDRQDLVESQFQEVIENTTDKDVVSAPEIIAARNGEPNLKSRLDKEKQEVTAQLAQTLKKTDSIAPSQIDKNKGKFDQTYMSDEFLQQMAGNASINAVPADNSITTNKLAPKAVNVGDIADELLTEFNGKKYWRESINNTRAALDIYATFDLSELGLSLNGKTIQYGYEGFHNDSNIVSTQAEIWNNDGDTLFGANSTTIKNQTVEPLYVNKYFTYSGEVTISVANNYLHLISFIDVSDKTLPTTVYLKNHYIIVDGIKYFQTKVDMHTRIPSASIEDKRNLPQRLADYSFTEATYAKKEDITAITAISKWNDKKIVMLGDSIVWQDGRTYANGVQSGQIARGYGTLFKEKLGFSEVLNEGVSGASIAERPEAYTDIYLTAQSVDYVPYDLVTIAGGTNDLKNNIPLGTIGNVTDSTFDNDTFYGAYRTIIEYILTQKPTIKICLFTPLQRDSQGFNIDTLNTNGDRLFDYVNAIKEIGEFYGLPVCDMYSNSGLNKLTLDTYTIDGLHPHDLGYERISDYAMSVLETI